MTDLPKAYDPAAVEPVLYADWESAGLFHAEAEAPGEPFSVVIPPPNVTGSLHVGHALDNTVQDAIVRRERMRGRNVVWVPGTDHAGIATQNVVEKQLAAEGTDRHAIGRAAFLERVWRWKAESGGTILTQLRTLGASADWQREAFTFDEARSRAVREVFVSLYEQGLIHRGYRLINWCVRCLTALSDIEVDHEDVEGRLTRFVYPFVDGEGGIEVATTRPETMLGDTAIAVHPDDERYAAAVGRSVRHPFQDRTIPVVADAYVDPAFGSGAVKVTPAHDPNDHAIGERHGLESIVILDEHGVTTPAVGERFAGMGRAEARVAVVAALRDAGLVVREDVHVHAVGHCQRCRTVVEPRLSDQWFVRVRPLADKAAAAVRDGRMTFVPASRTQPFLDWLDGLHDWCISRQIWWGHRIPAWYGPDGSIEVSREDIEREGWVQDEDVLDTWFSSALWPFSVFGWPEATPELARWFPTSTLVTGYDINTFWVSRMMMMSLWFLDDVPFRVVHNHGLVRDEHGKKMSKSFGNVIDPLDLIATYGADATRFALLRSAAPGTDVPLAEEWVEGAKRFVNKLWNAGRFALSNLEGQRPGPVPAEGLALEDRWVLSRAAAMVAEVESGYDGYDWPVVARGLYTFAWDELADWYLEAVKRRLHGDDNEDAAIARAVLAGVLDAFLRLAHPLLPFVTEALWRALTGATGGRDSLMVADWPAAPGPRDERAEADFAVVQDLVREVNRFRSQNRIAPSARFALTVAARPEAAAVLAAQESMVAALAGLDGLVLVERVDARPGTSTIAFAGGVAEVDLTGLIDVTAEVARLERERTRMEGERDRVATKLADAGFVGRAPEAVVAKERDKLAEAERVLAELGARLADLTAGRG
jgi:valyl-tRNA synthetase